MSSETSTNKNIEGIATLTIAENVENGNCLNGLQRSCSTRSTRKTQGGMINGGNKRGSRYSDSRIINSRQPLDTVSSSGPGSSQGNIH